MATVFPFNVIQKAFVSLHGRQLGMLKGLIAPGDTFLVGDGLHDVLRSVSDAIVVGSAAVSQATAVGMTAVVNRFSTVPSGGFANLPPMFPGMSVDVINDGANALQVCPSLTDPNAAPTIDGVAAATGVAVTNARRSRFTCLASGVIVSCGMAKST